MKVAFYRNQNEIFAVFPEEKADLEGNLLGYAHIGQHCAISSDYINESFLLPVGQYDDLLAELCDSVGYSNLVVLNAVKAAALAIVKELLAENDANSDLFGAVMSIWFEISEHMTAKYGYTPNDWQFKPGIGELSTVEYYDNLTEDCVIEMGNICNRLYGICKHKGLDY